MKTVTAAKTVTLAAILCASAGIALADWFVPSPPLPPDTWMMSFRDTPCRTKADGGYCGSGTNYRVFYRCEAGAVVEKQSCAGGCETATLQCKQ